MKIGWLAPIPDFRMPRDRFPGRLHAAGGMLLGGVAVCALATASGVAGFVVFAVGLFANSRD